MDEITPKTTGGRIADFALEAFSLTRIISYGLLFILVCIYGAMVYMAARPGADPEITKTTMLTFKEVGIFILGALVNSVTNSTSNK